MSRRFNDILKREVRIFSSPPTVFIRERNFHESSLIPRRKYQANCSTSLVSITILNLPAISTPTRLRLCFRSIVRITRDRGIRVTWQGELSRKSNWNRIALLHASSSSEARFILCSVSLHFQISIISNGWAASNLSFIVMSNFLREQY